MKQKQMNIMSSDYFAYSMMTFVMNYYNYYESTTQNSCEEVDCLFEKISSITKKTLLQPFDGDLREETLKMTDAIRSTVMEVMKSLTAYADQFAIYEYILNRVEKKFSEVSEKEIDDRMAAQEILKEIFADKDQMLINTRIRMMLSQLPIRMTKQKFLDMLKDSFSIYEGSDEESVNNYVYMLSSAAGLEKVELKFAFAAVKELEEKRNAMETMDVSFMKQEEYVRYTSILNDAVEIIQKNTDRLFSLQEVVNSFYCLLLNQPYASSQVLEETKNLLPILEHVSTYVENKRTESIPDEIVSLFELTEGKLEHYVSNLSKDESTIHEYETMGLSQIEAMMLRPQFECLLLSVKLCSNSAFIELNNQKSYKKANKAYIEAAFDQMASRLNEVLVTKNKWYHRAVIAAVLREMPVMFGSVDEVKDYVINSISGCKDIAEKSASIDLFYAGVSK